MRTLASLGIVAAFALSAAAGDFSPRKAPDFKITEPSGKSFQLSSLHGKVCVLEFLYTTCPHCQRESQMLTKLQKEMGPRGLQVVGVAFNDNAAVLVPGFVSQLGVTYPVGYSTVDAVLGYLGVSQMERWVVPQVVVIDRKGMIRAQSPALGDPNLQDEAYMRNFLDNLLKEGAPATKARTAKTSARVH